jgi:hypothetical protein
MRKIGFDPLVGTIALVEIPWTAAEVSTLKGQNLMEEGWEPPMPLIDLCPTDLKTIAGAWQLDATDSQWAFAKRRFAIIDGNNRITAIINTLADMPDFMANVSLNAFLVEVAIEDSLMVQLASMYCNRMGGKRISDTLADEVSQWQLILDAYCSLNPPEDWRKVPVAVATVVKWIKASVADIADLLPDSVKKGLPGKGAEDLKDCALTARVRLATKLPPYRVKWLQEYYIQVTGEKREETYGEQHSFCAHFLKMNSIYEEGAPDLIEFLQWRVKVLDQFAALKLSAQCTWSEPKKILA